MENTKEKKSTLFDVLEKCTVHQVKWEDLTDEEHKLWQPYIINRLVSSNDNFVPILALGIRRPLSNKAHYIFIQSILGNQKYYFNMKAYKTDKEDTLALFAIEKYYIVGKTDALRILNKMNIEELEKLKKKYENFYKYQKEMGIVK